VLGDLVDRGHGIMQDHFDDHEGRFREDYAAMFDHIREWMDKMQEKDRKTYGSVITDMYILVLNATTSNSSNVSA
jgi:cyclopropane fatty-acyl-phospholipid synthase-like methyltransferase